jgi:putative transposase
MRARTGLPSLRAPHLFQVIRESIRAASGYTFRVVHFSVQDDHVHLIVEAQDAGALSSGATGLSVRTARAINGVLGLRGTVWGERYGIRTLETPKATRDAIVYVLMNFRKHHPTDRSPIDPCSSAPWFEGFRGPMPAPTDPPPTWRPRTWLASAGWKRHGLIDPAESPTLI